MRRIFLMMAAAALMSISLSAQQKELTLDNVMDGTFYAKGAGSITPLSDGQHYLTSQNGTLILKKSFKTGAVTDTILDLSTARGNRLFSFDGFILSPTEDIILLQTNTNRIFRRSFTADYYLFTIRNNKIDPLTEGGPFRFLHFHRMATT